jgi:hypothetical protein
MRLLLFGMQSSGASLATYLLGQVPSSVVLVDLYSYELMPEIDVDSAEHVIAKAVITTTHSLDAHVHSFAPNRTILLLRDPVQNYVSLRRKEYANDDGELDAKFRILESVFSERSRFDLVLRYEDLVQNPADVIRELNAIGFPGGMEMYDFSRSRAEIVVPRAVRPRLELRQHQGGGAEAKLAVQVRTQRRGSTCPRAVPDVVRGLRDLHGGSRHTRHARQLPGRGRRRATDPPALEAGKEGTPLRIGPPSGSPQSLNGVSSK